MEILQLFTRIQKESLSGNSGFLEIRYLYAKASGQESLLGKTRFSSEVSSAEKALYRERTSTTAGTSGIGIIKRKTGTHNRIYEIHFYPLKILPGEFVNKDL